MTPLEKLEELARDLERIDCDTYADNLRRIGDELRATLYPAGNGETLTSAQQMQRAWVYVVDTLDDVRPNWRPSAARPRDAAVAAIRSMAAQCSAQTAVPAERSAGVPPLRRAQIGALQYAIGYLEARDRGAIALDLSTLHAWLVVNAPQE